MEDANVANGIPGWGIAMIQRKGIAYLVRFEMN
jgi:hypothetical protein